MFAASVFTYQWQTQILHLQRQKELNFDNGEFWFAGFVLPIDKTFYKDTSLENTRFVLAQQFPFSMSNPNKKENIVSYDERKKQEEQNNPHNTCLIDAIVMPMVMRIWKESMNEVTQTVKKGIWKYPGCAACGNNPEPHMTFPWAPVLNKKAKYKTNAYSKTTWTTIIRNWISLAEHDKQIRQIATYFFCATLIAAHKIYTKEKKLIWGELATQNLNVNQCFPIQSLQFLGIENLHLHREKDHPKCFDIEKHNNFDTWNQPTTITHYKFRPIYLQCTSTITVQLPYSSELDEIFITGSMKNSRQKDAKILLEPFTRDQDLSSPIHKVNCNIYI